MTDIETERLLTEKHILLHRNKTVGKILPRPNCELCYPIKGPKTRSSHIEKLFDLYQRLFPEALAYNSINKEEYSRLKGNLATRRTLRSTEKLNKLDTDTEERAINIVLSIRYQSTPRYSAEQIAYSLTRTVYKTAALTQGDLCKEFIQAANFYQTVTTRKTLKTQKEIELRTKLYDLSEEEEEEIHNSFYSPIELSPKLKSFPSSK